MLKFGQYARFNNLFRCIEPQITGKFAQHLTIGSSNKSVQLTEKTGITRTNSQQRIISNLCVLADLARGHSLTQYTSPVYPHGQTAYFLKAYHSNGILPNGTKSLIDMHQILKCLNMKEKLPTGNTQLSGTSRSKIAAWIDSFTLYSFNDVPENLSSILEFKKSSEILFDSYPEIRRSCFENIVGYNGINGTNCQINPTVNIPLVSREFLHQTIFLLP